MYKGQKSVRNGIEDFMCPFTDFYLTCGPNESKAHMGTMAIDVRGKEKGVRYPYYAPATVKCLWTYPATGQAKWQTVNNVRCSNGYIGKVTFMTCHDDSFDAVAGKTIVPQGSQLGNMGTKSDKGDVTGVHCHIECSQSADNSWVKNSYGNWCFPTEVDPEDVFFMDNTNILNGIGNWKYLKDVPAGEAVDQILHKGSKVQIPGTFEVVDINVKDNTALVRINGKDYWLSSTPLLEV